MFRTIRRIATITVGTAIFSAALFTQASGAWAPTMLGDTVTNLRALGYEVCEPVIAQLPAELAAEGVLAMAGPTPMFADCEIDFAVGFDPEAIDWVAHHEACHLATMNDIHADPYHEQLEDPYHQHPLFSACLDHGPAERGGY